VKSNVKPALEFDRGQNGGASPGDCAATTQHQTPMTAANYIEHVGINVLDVIDIE
jgi:hypothetical protein